MQTGTWGNGILNAQNKFAHTLGAIFVPLTTSTGSKKDKGLKHIVIAFSTLGAFIIMALCIGTHAAFLADPESCPEIVNKWECLFLPATNCPWPDLALHCRNSSCASRELCYNSATPGGVVVNSAEIRDILQKRMLPLPDHIPQVGLALTMQSNHADGLITPSAIETTTRGGGSALESHFIHENLTCVAVHVRRDDRAIAGEDMLAWCRNHTKIVNGEKKLTGQWVDGVCAVARAFLPLLSQKM
jgi:hypothetical protein